MCQLKKQIKQLYQDLSFIPCYKCVMPVSKTLNMGNGGGIMATSQIAMAAMSDRTAEMINLCL